MIEIDGSHLEGGGQILRTAAGLSVLTGKACRITDIRKNRPRGGGLMNQHLTAINAAAKICDAKLKGAEIGSIFVEFTPGTIKPGKYSFDVGTAGSVSLVLQALLIPSFDKTFEFEITGGTDVQWSPNTSYFQHVFCDFLKKMGADVRIDTIKHGFYPKGGGIVNVKIKKCDSLKTIWLTKRGELKSIDARSVVSDMLKAKKVGERQNDGFKKVMKTDRDFVEYANTLSPGSSIQAHAHYDNCKLGACGLGAVDKKAEDVGRECAMLLKKQMDSGACLDEWMADQILPYIAVAASQGNGESNVSVAVITKHLLTNVWVIEKFLPVKFAVNGAEGESGTVIVRKI